MMTLEEKKAVADSMGVSVNDMMTMANSIVNSLEQDGAVEAFMNAGEEDQTKLTQAYAAHAVKKLDKFTATYLTNPEARQTFQERVFNDLKDMI